MADTNNSAGFFTSFDGLNKLMDFLLKARQPREHTFFFTDSEMKPIDDFFRNLGSAGVTSEPLKGTGIGCTKICYGGFDFTLVNVDKPRLIMDKTTVNKGDMVQFYLETEREAVTKTFFISEVGIDEFIGVELGNDKKVNFRFFKQGTNPIIINK